MSSSRVQYIDALRGFAMFLVVIGHSIQFNLADYGSFRAYNAIYSFHMPLFFFISGYVLYLSSSKKTELSIHTVLQSVFQRACSLMAPSIVWTAIILYVLTLDIPLTNPISGFWFLNLLFIIDSIGLVACYLSNRSILLQKLVLVSIALMLTGCFAIGFKIVPAMYGTLFFFGCIVCKFRIIEKLTPFYVTLIGVVFLVGMLVFQYEESPSRVAVELPTSMAASLFLAYIFLVLERHFPKLSHALAIVGRYSIGVYLMHFIVIRNEWLGGLPTIVVPFAILLLSVLIVVACVSIQKLVSKSHFLDALLFGKFPKIRI